MFMLCCCGKENMPIGNFYRLRNMILMVLILLGFGLFASIFVNGRTAALGFQEIGRSLTEAPIFSFLPRTFLNKWAVSISRERNADVLKNVLEVFDPALRPFLMSVPIIFDSSANTAKSYPAKGYVAVSPDWDNSVFQSDRRAIYEQRGMRPEDPVFARRFKTDLLIHEFLHILQIQQKIDRHVCYDTIERWYKDPRYGIPSPNGRVHPDTKEGIPPQLAFNRIKYVVWYQLYNYRKLSDVPHDGSWKNMHYVERYRLAKRGVEEFAYVGEAILSAGSASRSFDKTGLWSDKDWKNKRLRLLEVSPEVIALYKGLFNPELMQYH